MVKITFNHSIKFVMVFYYEKHLYPMITFYLKQKKKNKNKNKKNQKIKLSYALICFDIISHKRKFWSLSMKAIIYESDLSMT